MITKKVRRAIIKYLYAVKMQLALNMSRIFLISLALMVKAILTWCEWISAICNLARLYNWLLDVKSPLNVAIKSKNNWLGLTDSLYSTVSKIKLLHLTKQAWKTITGYMGVVSWWFRGDRPISLSDNNLFFFHFKEIVNMWYNFN